MSKRAVVPAEVRFWEKVEKTDTCWLWRASLRDGGYPQFNNGVTTVRAHRWAYEQFVGPIPDGLQLDHLCRVRHCVNPTHLEPVTQTENVRRGQSPTAANARKTHCVHGHPFDGANTYVWRNGERSCKACVNAWRRNRRIDKTCLRCGVQFKAAQPRTQFCSQSCGARYYADMTPRSQNPRSVARRLQRAQRRASA